MTCDTIKKHAADRLDWVINYSRWLVPTDIIITASTSLVEGLDLGAVIEGDSVRLWVSGGESGKSYQSTLKITTAGGRVKTECIKVRIR
jgi:hypothetical protein